MENGTLVTQTRTVTETEWWGLSGEHHNYYSGYLVSGSRGLPQNYAEGIKPFRLEALKRYQPFFLAGWLSEEYSVERDAALELSQQEFQRWEQKNIEKFLPGDSHSSVEVQTRVQRYEFGFDFVAGVFAELSVRRQSVSLPGERADGEDLWR